jgi:cytochrome oxidase Cu insertion factor (SCO1/SenC/PrrC family)
MKKFVAIMLTLLMTVGFASMVLAAEEAEKGPVYGNKIGDTLKPFSLKDFDGNSFDSAKMITKDKGMFVIVNAVCTVCSAEMNAIAKKLDKFEAKANIFIVAVDMNPERAIARYKQYADKVTILHDPDFSLGTNAGLYSTPSTLILSKKGEVVYKQSGYRKEFLKKYMEML